MRRHRMDRRALLRGAAGGLAAAIALPTLEAMLNGNGTAHADGSPLPVRLGVWYWGSGVHKARFFPRTPGPAWEMTPELAPLERVRGDLNVLGGYEVKQDGVVHHIGTAVMKTGRGYIQAGGGAFNTDVAVASFDVDVARAIGKDSPVQRLDVGVFSDGKFKGEGINTRALSHNGPNSPNMAETSPQAVFDLLFGGRAPGMAGAAGADAKAAAAHALGRKSVLDVVTAEARALRGRVGAADGARLDQHLEALREIEKRLATAGAAPPAGRCTPPARPALGKPDLRMPDVVGTNKLMAELVALALSCDLTRVFTFRHHGWTDDPVFAALGAQDTHHNLTHNEGGAQPVVQKINEFTMAELAVFLERLKGTAVAGGTLLDRCAILAYSEVGEGRNHARSDIPILVAGKAGGALKTGLYHRSTTRESVTKVHVTMLRALGLAPAGFGEGPNRVTDGVAAIEGGA